MGTPLSSAEMIDHAKIAAAHEAATRDLLLEHARMGRAVCESRDGQIVTVPPAEVFARYGLDEHGNPKEAPVQNEYITDPDLIAQVRERERLNELLSAGKLDQYFGQYLIAGEGQIFAHSENLRDARREAEPKATAAGISSARLTYYYVPGPELSVMLGAIR